MKYLIKFDEQGRRELTYPIDTTMKPEKVAELQEQGFIIVEDEDYQLLLGNVDGKEYVRNADGTYSEYVPALDELKTQKMQTLKTKRDALEVEPIEYAGNLFDYDDKARDRINAAIIALDIAGEGASLSWTTANNTEAIVTANDLRAIIAAVAVRSNELHVKYRQLKEQVEACMTQEELEQVVWE